MPGAESSSLSPSHSVSDQLVPVSLFEFEGNQQILAAYKHTLLQACRAYLNSALDGNPDRDTYFDYFSQWITRYEQTIYTQTDNITQSLNEFVYGLCAVLAKAQNWDLQKAWDTLYENPVFDLTPLSGDYVRTVDKQKVFNFMHWANQDLQKRIHFYLGQLNDDPEHNEHLFKTHDNKLEEPQSRTPLLLCQIPFSHTQRGQLQSKNPRTEKTWQTQAFDSAHRLGFLALAWLSNTLDGHSFGSGSQSISVADFHPWTRTKTLDFLSNIKERHSLSAYLCYEWIQLLVYMESYSETLDTLQQHPRAIDDGFFPYLAALQYSITQIIGADFTLLQDHKGAARPLLDHIQLMKAAEKAMPANEKTEIIDRLKQTADLPSINNAMLDYIKGPACRKHDGYQTIAPADETSADKPALGYLDFVDAFARHLLTQYQPLNSVMIWLPRAETLPPLVIRRIEQLKFQQTLDTFISENPRLDQQLSSAIKEIRGAFNAPNAVTATDLEGTLTNPLSHLLKVDPTRHQLIKAALTRLNQPENSVFLATNKVLESLAQPTAFMPPQLNSIWQKVCSVPLSLKYLADQMNRARIDHWLANAPELVVNQPQEDESPSYQPYQTL